MSILVVTIDLSSICCGLPLHANTNCIHSQAFDNYFQLFRICIPTFQLLDFVSNRADSCAFLNIFPCNGRSQEEESWNANDAFEDERTKLRINLLKAFYLFAGDRNRGPRRYLSLYILFNFVAGLSWVSKQSANLYDYILGGLKLYSKSRSQFTIISISARANLRRYARGDFGMRKCPKRFSNGKKASNTF